MLLFAYLAVPIDLVPDFIPVVGYGDDVVVVALVLRSVTRAAAPEAPTRHWPGSADGLRPADDDHRPTHFDNEVSVVSHGVAVRDTVAVPIEATANGGCGVARRLSARSRSEPAGPALPVM